ncbi:MAG TPA: TIGR03032 family protein [Tepidisphaeraceae bacterium]|jgi:uncharacterized protein (TIGR03032 family)|nr:TIGR03032 family protein [Tepidisphaeraceae bacterium]
MPDQSTSTGGDRIECKISDAFATWMSQANGSLAITTYQAGKVVLVGWDPKLNQVTLLPRQFDKPMGLARSPDSRLLALATRHSVILLADAPLLAPDYLEDQKGKYGALYLPRAQYFTGDLNIHDLTFDTDNKLWLVNTRFCCLSHLSTDHSFIPDWKPPFVSDIVPEDRCHLNGLAIVNGKPRYATSLGETNTVGGWRDNKASGGILIDIEANQIILRGLSMPHSPRWRNDQLYLLNSGAGQLLSFDPKTKQSKTIIELPGYLRGLSFAGHFALVGLCQIREKHIFGGLAVQHRHPKLLCGVAIIDLRSGQQAAFFEFTAGVQELYEVLFLPNVHRPMILNTEKDATRQAFTAPQFSFWLRPSSEIK